MDQSIRIVGRVGDRNPLNEGGVILDHGDGAPQLVWLTGIDDDEWLRFTCDLLDIDDALNGPGNQWADARAVASCCDMDPAELVRLSKSDDLQERAWALISVAAYYGWENFDSYPERYTEAEAEAWSDMLDAHEREQVGKD